MASNATHKVQRAAEQAMRPQGGGDAVSPRPVDDAINYLREYARENPESAALWCFGIGFVLGWKLKPW